MSEHRHTMTTPSDTELVMTRSFRAPRELVFAVHTSCEHLRHWWGPSRYEVAECELDARPGGAWRIVHAGPEGERHEFFGEFREFDPPASFTWTFTWGGAPDHPGVERYAFEETDGVTTLTATSTFGSREERDAMTADGGMEEGAVESWARLDAYLVEMAAGEAAR